MKKYLFGLIAVAFAVAFSAFTNVNTSKKTGDLIKFEFRGASALDYNDDQYWIDVTEGGEILECGQSGDLACVVETTEFEDAEAMVAHFVLDEVTPFESSQVSVTSQKDEE